MHPSLEGKVVAQVKTIIVDVNVVEVNFVTTNKIIEDQVFQERKRRKNKSTIDWEEEEKLKKQWRDNLLVIQSTNYQ